MKENLIHSVLVVASIPALFSIFYLAARGTSLYILHRKAKQNKIMHQDQIAKQIDSLIADTKGKFFSLKFIKKDGTIRTINGKDRYNRLVKGTGSPATDALKAKGYKNAVNRNGESWVSFMPEKVVEFKCGAVHKTF
jgi:phage/plasmid primase-like uncharacterized protein